MSRSRSIAGCAHAKATRRAGPASLFGGRLCEAAAKDVGNRAVTLGVKVVEALKGKGGDEVGQGVEGGTGCVSPGGSQEVSDPVDLSALCGEDELNGRVIKIVKCCMKLSYFSHLLSHLCRGV